MGTRSMRFYPKKDERCRRRGVKLEPSGLVWVNMLSLGRSHYMKSFHQDHMLSYIWWKRFVSFKQSTSLSTGKSLLSVSISNRVGLRKLRIFHTHVADVSL